MTKNSIKLEMTGSTDELHEITLFQEEDHIRLKCTCPNGQYDNTSYCKHRKSLLSGDLHAFNNPPADAAERIDELLSQATWLDGHASIAKMEKELAALKRKIKSTKKKVAQAMNGKGNSYL